MPFKSRRQARAAFGGHIPGFSKERAKEWASETDFSKLPEKAASAARVSYILQKLKTQLDKPKERRDLGEALSKVSFALPGPGKVMEQARHVGSFPGKATTNFLKAPGSPTAGVTNPRLSLRNAMTKSMRV